MPRPDAALMNANTATVRVEARPQEQALSLREIRTGAPISPHNAATRIAAYVYGNIIMLATLSSVGQEEAASGAAALLLLGAAASTFLAHALAGGIGRRLHADHRLTGREVLSELRDSVPILTAAVLPAVVVTAAGMTGLPVLWAQLAAGSYLVLLLGSTGALVVRFRGAPSSGRVVAAGAALAALGVAITVIKVLVSH